MNTIRNPIDFIFTAKWKGGALQAAATKVVKLETT